MKEWLKHKHKHGYLNIDKNNLYFTKTGNWSEIADLKEQNSTEFKTADQNSKIKLISFLGIIGSVFLWIFLSGIGNGNFTILQIIGPIVTAYFVYNYLIPEYGAAFAVPYNKIQKIELENDIATVHFLDYDGAKATYRLMKLDLNGIDLINRIELA
ncbi:MAG: hypothetical protein ACJASQ_002645 [Crocinitomicaceae bacterium]|jgi:hypothetical protein